MESIAQGGSLLAAAPNPLAEGWLLATIAIVISLITPATAIISKVRAAGQRREKALEAIVSKLEEEAVVRTDALTEAKISAMFNKKRVEDLERELDNWRSGKWRAN